MLSHLSALVILARLLCRTASFVRATPPVIYVKLASMQMEAAHHVIFIVKLARRVQFVLSA